METKALLQLMKATEFTEQDSALRELSHQTMLLVLLKYITLRKTKAEKLKSKDNYRLWRKMRSMSHTCNSMLRTTQTSWLTNLLEFFFVKEKKSKTDSSEILNLKNL